MSVHYLRDYPRAAEKRPREICFHSAAYRNLSGQQAAVNICVRLEDGDWRGLVSIVQEDGGIAEQGREGDLLFVPWPCAAVTIRDCADA